MALFPWDVETYEKGTEYFKSLNLKYVCGPLPEKNREKLALPIQPIHPTEQEEDLGYDDGVDDYQTGNDIDGIEASVVKEIGCSVGRKRSTFRNEYSPPSKKRLFSDGNPKVPSTIPELYAAMVDSEKRIIAFCRNEFAKFRKEMKGDEAVVDEDVGGKGAGDNGAVEGDVGDKAAGDKAAVEGDVGDKAAIEDIEEHGDQQDVEEDVEDVGVQQDVSFLVDAGNQSVIGGEQDSLGEGVKRGKGGEEDEAVVEGVKVVGSIAIEGDGMVEDSGEKSILYLEEHPSPSVCIIAENFPGSVPGSVVALTEADPHVEYRDSDKQRARKRVRYLQTLYTDPMPKKTKKSNSNEEDIDLVEFTSFLKNDDQVSFYTGQILPMTRQLFKELVNVDKCISDMHIHSYFDILWRRRLSSELGYVQNIGLVNTSFFTSINIKWETEMKSLNSLREIIKSLKDDQERSKPKETTSPPPPPQQKKDRKKKVKKTIVTSPKVVNVWEEYPEFVPLDYQPSTDVLRHVTGHELLYPQPWWQLDSVLIPCHVHGHWLLCHVLLKEGKVWVYDSLNERKSGLSPRLKDIRGLLYLFPSVLKHAGYYQQLKMDPHCTPFTAESMHSDVIPQQDDGNSCGAYLMKYAELIMAGVPTPWKSIFGQKNIKNIRKAIAIDIFTNGQIRNSP